MTYDAIIVGGGMAGLTAAAFLAKAGKSVLLCEKENDLRRAGQFLRTRWFYL